MQHGRARREGAAVRCVSIRQPWASLVAHGEKTVELRTWAIAPGPLFVASSTQIWVPDDPELARWVREDGDTWPRGVLIGQVTVASFANPAGLQAAGDNFLFETGASGAAQIGIAGEGGLFNQVFTVDAP